MDDRTIGGKVEAPADTPGPNASGSFGYVGIRPTLEQFAAIIRIIGPYIDLLQGTPTQAAVALLAKDSNIITDICRILNLPPSFVTVGKVLDFELLAQARRTGLLTCQTKE